MNQAQYEQKVLRLAAQRGVTLDITDVSESLDNALDYLAREVAQSPLYYHLQKDYTVAIASGTADLSAETDILIDTVERVQHEDGSVFSRLPAGANRSDLTLPRNEFQPFYVIERNAIFAKMGNGVDTPADGDLTVTANFVPTLATLPGVFDPDLIEAGFMISQGASAQVGA